MPTKRRNMSRTRELGEQFYQEVVQESREPMSRTEIHDALQLWLDEEPGRRDEFESGALEYQVSALIHGMEKDHTTFVDPDTEGKQYKLFPERWHENGMLVAGGYIANPNATHEHLVDNVSKKDRRVEKARYEAEIERQRLSALEVGFSAGAETAGEALSVISEKKEWSGRHDDQQPHIGA